MAAEEEKEQEESGKKKKKGGKLKLIIIVVLLLVILGGGGFVAYKIFLAPKATEEEVKKEEDSKAAAAANEIGTLFPLETFIVNMVDNEGSRYLKVTLQLEIPAGEEKETLAMTDELTKRIPQLRDAILTILAAKRYEEVSSAQGKLILKQEILRRVNSLLPKGEISNVYFTEFVSQ